MPLHLPPLLQDTWAAVRGEEVLLAGRWPRRLRAAFPGPRRRVEAWTGEGAAFARYASGHGPLFLKYVPAGWRDQRAFQRLRREAAYLRDLAPLSPVPHAPHLYSGLHERRWQGYLLTRDLTDLTTGWGAFQTDDAREAALLDVVRLLARHHAFWAGADGQGHAALTGPWAWTPQKMTRAPLMATPQRADPYAALIQEVARQLPHLLAQTSAVTLAHGDIHSGQVLWPKGGSQPILIDYGQVHPSIPGEDLAHLLAIRLSAEDRARLGQPLRAAYYSELERLGLKLTAAEQRAQERAGLAINLLSTARQAARASGSASGVHEALKHVVQAWQEQA